MDTKSSIRPIRQPVRIGIDSSGHKPLVVADGRLVASSLVTEIGPDLIIPDLALALGLTGSTLAALAGTSIDELYALISSEVENAFGAGSQAVFGETTHPATRRQSLVIGVFFERSDDPEVTGVREHAIPALFGFAGDLFEGGSEGPFGGAGFDFGFWWNRATIRRLINEAWQSVPKRFSLAGKPDPCGRVLLDGFEIDFPPIDGEATLELRIRGHIDVPNFWDAPFVVMIRESIVANATYGTLDCMRTHEDLELGLGWDAARQVVDTVWDVLRGALWFSTGLSLPGLSQPSIPATPVICEFTKRIPSRILLPESQQKLMISFGRAHPDFRFAGVFYADPLEPVVDIGGPRKLYWNVGQADASGTYRVGTNGELIDPLSITWSSDGVVSNPTGRQTAITFATPAAESNARHTVSVSVVDSIGQTSQDSITVLVTPRLNRPEFRDVVGTPSDAESTSMPEEPVV